MEITKVELKILIKEFLTASNRMLRAGFEIYSEELEKFTRFLESRPLIWEYIVSCGEPEFDVEKTVEEIKSSYGDSIFDLGTTNEKEVANIYAVIKYLADKKYNGRSSLFYGYSSSKKYQDKVDGFGEKYIRIMITHIENYLATLSIRMGMDEKMAVQVEIKDSNLTNTQVTVSGNDSSVTVTQNNSNFNKLEDLIKEILGKLESLEPEEKEIVSECIETIETIKDEKPKKSIIKMALTTLQGVAGTTEFLAAVASLVQYVETLL